MSLYMILNLASVLIRKYNVPSLRLNFSDASRRHFFATWDETAPSRATCTDQQKAGEFKPSHHPSADAHVHEERNPATARQRILREPARRRGAIAPRQLRQLVSCRSGPIDDQS